MSLLLQPLALTSLTAVATLAGMGVGCADDVGTIDCGGGACGFVYVARPEGIDQGAAEAYCVSTYRTHLASVHSADDQAAIDAIIPCADGVCGTPWIGGVASAGFCAGNTEIYDWTDGSAWDFSAWRASTNEPNCSRTPGCIQFWPTGAGSSMAGWNDVNCDAGLTGFVCQLP